MSQFNQAITTIQKIMVKFGYKQPVTGKLDDATIIGLQTILNKLKSQRTNNPILTQAKPPTVAKPQMQNPPPRTAPPAPPPRTNIN
jgi:hypothetical protein